ncbi:MFS transporter [Phaeacidiphilus oryzae]|uniref:MFS transporter n=1 Tax=Phaeacidiphilus oryzae TaxID=348818 RepID=UPI00055FCD88|nr:MFS transporter [Phaeacidiphilus oryzae]
MHTYRELFRGPESREFTPLFALSSLQTAALTASGIALGTLVYAASHSPLLSALSMFGPSFGQLIGATLLMSAADRLPPRALLTALPAFFALTTALLALPGLPALAIAGIVLAEGLAGAVGGGARVGLLSEVLPEDGYVLGRSVLNISVGLCQILGYALGGTLIAALGSRGTLLAAAGGFAAAALAARLGLRSRPARASGRPSIAATWRINAELWSRPARRWVYGALWVPNGLVVGCEALFVPYAPTRAGWLFAAGALGMLAGDVWVGRFLPQRLHGRFAAPLRLLLAAPYPLLLLRPGLGFALPLVALASVGYAASLLLQERLIALTPRRLHGQALGLHGSGMLTMQAVGATAGGLLAERMAAGTAMAVLGAVSLAVTLALAPGLREEPAGAPRSSRPISASGGVAEDAQ